MHIIVDDELARLDLYAEGLEQEMILGMASAEQEPRLVASFDQPRLLTDNAAIARLEPGLRDAVFALYQSYPRTVSYLGCELSWSPDRYPRVWCPSIDTLFFARTLSRYLGVETTSIAELGTGSGFLSKLALERSTAISRAMATDINPEAIRCASDAVAGLARASALSLVRVAPGSDELGLSGCFDLLISNPPYIPRPQARHDNPYEGLDLVGRIAAQGAAHLAPGGRLLLNISSLAGEEWRRWFTDAGWRVIALEEMRVPLKVNTVTSGLSEESRNWLSYLEHRRLAETDDPRVSGYRYWHRLRMFELSRS